MCSKPNPLSLTLTNLPVTKGHHCQGRNQREKIQSALTSSVFTLCLWQPRVPDAAYGQCPYQHCSLSETGSNHCCCSIVSRLFSPFSICVCALHVYMHILVYVCACVWGCMFVWVVVNVHAQDSCLESSSIALPPYSIGRFSQSIPECINMAVSLASLLWGILYLHWHYRQAIILLQAFAWILGIQTLVLLLA